MRNINILPRRLVYLHIEPAKNGCQSEVDLGLRQVLAQTTSSSFAEIDQILSESVAFFAGVQKPTLWLEGFWVGEMFGVFVHEDRCHANGRSSGDNVVMIDQSFVWGHALEAVGDAIGYAVALLHYCVEVGQLFKLV